MRPTVRGMLPERSPDDPLVTCFEAGFLLSDNSGWREAQPSFDMDVCVGCGLCYMYCPDGAISMSDGRPRVDLGFCKGCGICSRLCRPGAVTMEARS